MIAAIPAVSAGGRRLCVGTEAHSRAWPRLAVAICAALLTWSWAIGQEADERAFSGLTVVAFGDQEIDIVTGVTTLPQGGRVVAREHGVTIEGESIRYLEEEFIEAEGVSMSGPFGSATAASVRIDLAAGRLDATGALRFSGDGYALRADALVYFSEPEIVRFVGSVVGEGVDFTAAALALDAHSGDLLLAAPYSYREGLIELSSGREGALLSLQPIEGEELAFRASSQPPEQILARLAPYLP